MLTNTYDFSFNNTVASMTLPVGVSAPALTFTTDRDSGTVEVILTHEALSRPVATDCAAATYEEAFAIFAQYSYLSARFYAKCFQAAVS